MLASCAGGCSSRVTLKLDKNKVTGTKLSITLSGLTGGHSGVEIDKGRGNANVLMSRILRDVITDNNVYLARLTVEERITLFQENVWLRLL